MAMDTNRLRYVSVLMLLVVCAFFLTARLVYLFMADPHRFPINSIKITASYRHISHQQLESILTHYIQSSFFSLPVGHLYYDLMAIPWTNQVQIERVWPDTLRIILIEKIPVAIWDNKMLTKEGELFDSKGVEMSDSLPSLNGPENQQKKVLQVYQKMSKILSIYGLHAIALKQCANQDWELTLANSVTLRLGKQDLETRITRFCRAYPAIYAEKAEQLVAVDLRYPKGLAAQWKKETGR